MPAIELISLARSGAFNAAEAAELAAGAQDQTVELELDRARSIFAEGSE